MSFDGIPAGTTDFLAGLRADNSKQWLEAHRSDYDEYYVGVGKDLVVAAQERLSTLVPGIRAEPKVLGSIFRINRDTRFSADKRPYKDHLDMWLWEGERKGAVSGFFLRVTPEFVGVGVGAHSFDNATLPRFRDAAAGAPGAALAAAVEQAEAAGLEVGGEHYKRMPKGYDADGPGARFLLYNALHAFREMPLGPKVTGKKALDTFMGVWEPAVPLHRWLVEHLG